MRRCLAIARTFKDCAERDTAFNVTERGEISFAWSCRKWTWHRLDDGRRLSAISGARQLDVSLRFIRNYIRDEIVLCSVFSQDV